MRCLQPQAAKTANGVPTMRRCRQCITCRVREQQQWTIRNALEETPIELSAFVTLTYEDGHRQLAPLDYRDIQSFFKALRKKSANPIRFFCCGEYGESSGHAHWHLILHGYPSPTQSLKGVQWHTGPWSLGYSHIGPVTKSSIRYATRYCLKGFRPDDERGPPIRASSLKPGLGSSGLISLGMEMFRHGRAWDPTLSAIRMEGNYFPLNPFMRSKLAVGYAAAGGCVTHLSEDEKLDRYRDQLLEEQVIDIEREYRLAEKWSEMKRGKAYASTSPWAV